MRIVLSMAASTGAATAELACATFVIDLESRLQPTMHPRLDMSQPYLLRPILGCCAARCDSNVRS